MTTLHLQVLRYNRKSLTNYHSGIYFYTGEILSVISLPFLIKNITYITL